MFDGAIIFAGLMPHAPVLVPGVGGENLARVRATVSAMTALAGRVAAARPDSVVLISPHSPRRAAEFGIWSTPRLRGSFEAFGSSEAVDLPLDQRLSDQIETEAARLGLRTWRIVDETLDHGATVPLHFLSAAGWSGPTAILSLSETGGAGLDEFGRAIAAAVRSLAVRAAVIASGDMSHRLSLSAPAGYHPEASRFDEAFVGALRKGAGGDVRQISRRLQAIAAEDVIESTRVALAASGYRADRRNVLSYEGPFGVGYAVAVLFEPEGSSGGKRPLSNLADLPAVARRAVATRLAGSPETLPFRAEGALEDCRGVFVTLRTSTGELRGCVGSIAPGESDLVRETWRSALLAAFEDGRFSPVRAAEIGRLRFSVTVLDPMEPVVPPAPQDPSRYGVLVRARDGRSGLLLPGIAGIDTGRQQLEVVRQKAGIGSDEPIEMQRFTANSFEEPGGQEKGGGFVA
jgi:AmmeMemoRadiSam system protein A